MREEREDPVREGEPGTVPASPAEKAPFACVTEEDIDAMASGCRQGLSLSEKLRILGAGAKYDVSCASSGSQRGGSGKAGTVGSSLACGICHSFTSDGRCVSLLKILLSNDCVYDCRYCVNRRSNDIPRASFTPEEVVALTMNLYKRNYIEGLFLSSAVFRSPDETMANLCRILYQLRYDHGFYGYIHCKAIPGADERLVEMAGRLADRMSVNIEMPTEQSLSVIAPQKKKDAILTPMKYMKHRILEDQEESRRYTAIGTAGRGALPFHAGAGERSRTFTGGGMLFQAFRAMPETFDRTYGGRPRLFIPAGQSTQMIIGATPDTDAVILRLSESLYQKMHLKRVYYSAYTAVNEDSLLPARDTPPPLLREHRLYQADWLLRFYGFTAEELLEGSGGNLSLTYDPKCEWALRHLDLFPVEINQAPYEMLLRIPGVGVNSAKRILTARQTGSLDFDGLKRLGVVLKRAQFFITCKGRSLGKIYMEPDFIKGNLSLDERVRSRERHYTPLSLFDSAG